MIDLVEGYSWSDNKVKQGFRIIDKKYQRLKDILVEKLKLGGIYRYGVSGYQEQLKPIFKEVAAGFGLEVNYSGWTQSALTHVISEITDAIKEKCGSPKRESAVEDYYQLYLQSSTLYASGYESQPLRQSRAYIVR